MTRYTVAEEIAEKPIPEQRSHVLKTGTPRSFVVLRFARQSPVLYGPGFAHPFVSGCRNHAQTFLTAG